MSQAQLIGQVTPPRTWHMYRAMVGVGLLCGLLIVTVFEWTRPVIARNKAEALRRAIFQVLPDARSSTTFRFAGEEHFESLQAERGDGPLIYAGYDAEHRLVGLAVEAQGMGYQDVIRVLYGYSFAEDAIVGIRVLESRETPGLGDKIETDADFLENFARLVVSLTDDLSGILHPIEFVKHGKKAHPWQIDGITGATISSAAIANILDRSTAYWIPRIRQNLNDFREVE
ncbi:MAG: FMN-binding protein [Planctomycetota bacterium]|jgi:electron transport complex protein RnfG